MHGVLQCSWRSAALSCTSQRRHSGVAPELTAHSPRTCCAANRTGSDSPGTEWQRPKARCERDVKVNVASSVASTIRFGSPELQAAQAWGARQAITSQAGSNGLDADQEQLKAVVKAAVKQQQASKPLLLKACQTGADELRTLSNGLNLTALGLGLALAAGKAAGLAADVWPESFLWYQLSDTIGQTWQVYAAAVEQHPLAVKAAISGVVYALGDLTAQTYEGRSLVEADKARVLRSALCGFLAHGPLAHLYYNAIDRYFTVSPLFSDSWFVPIFKIGVDQTLWAVTWNSLYYAALGLMKLDRPGVVGRTLAGSWWGCLRAGWRFWPIAHLVTYTIIPTQHKVLWVDMCELAWVTVLSYYGQQQRQQAAAAIEAAGGADAWEGAAVTQVACALPTTGICADEILRGMQVERSGICFEDEDGDLLCRPVEDVYAEAAIAEMQLQGVPVEVNDPTRGF